MNLYRNLFYIACSCGAVGDLVPLQRPIYCVVLAADINIWNTEIAITAKLIDLGLGALNPPGGHFPCL